MSRDFSPFLRPALGLWLRGNLLQPLGFVLYALRGRIDDSLSVVLANALIVIAFADYARALHLLLRRPDPRRLALAAVVFLMVVIAVFTWVFNSVPIRIVVASLVLGGLNLLAARGLLSGPWREQPVARRLIAAVFSISALVLFLRAGYTWLQPDAVRDGLETTAVQALTFGTGAVLPLLTSYGFLLLCNERMRQELERSAAIDFLTGALNRGAIEGLGTRAITRARRHGGACAAIVIDVDHFKCINDAYGHAVGDAALREIVRRLQDNLRGEDALGRLGGEEFLVLLDDTDPERAQQAAERLRQAIRATPLSLESGPHPSTISLGVAVLDGRDNSFSDLLRRADRALYAAKEAGRDRVEMAAS